MEGKTEKLVTDRISDLKQMFKRPNQKILNDHGVTDCLRKPHENFVLVTADKAANNIIVIWKTYSTEILTEELRINSSDQINSTHVPSTDSYKKILKSHCDFIKVNEIEVSRRSPRSSLFVLDPYQVIPGNDQNTIPTNQEIARSKLERTS